MKVTGVVLIVALFGYWFFMHTIRGSSIAVYVIGGWHAPIGVKFACAQETDARVKTKFMLPLLFDEATKDQLRGFWYYSYYRGCLFAHGYDFSGNPVPKSSISVQGTTSTYTNAYGGFSFDLLGTFSLDTDNVLNVDWDDQLFVSKLSSHTLSFTVDTHLKHEHFTSFEDIANTYAQHPFSTTTILSSEIRTTATDAQVLYVYEADGVTRLVFISDTGHIVDIHGSDMSEALIQNIISSLTIFPTFVYPV